ncbi:hypothetical protein MMC17_008009 [Xylographa soralifera]|nr:hypothetical protein [Xylographa soralifera]
MQLNREINGTWKNLEQVVDRLITHVVPQVLGPLEAEGRAVKPTLIHGDLWDGNIGTDFKTGEIYVFDASVYYAHNKMEIGMWRGKFNKVVSSKVYLNSYLSRMGISEPTEQFDDRNRIYSCYMLLHESACHNGSSFREEKLGPTLTMKMTIVSEDAVENEKILKNISHPPFPTTPLPLPSPPQKQENSVLEDNASQPPAPPYSHFTKTQKRLTFLLVTFAATFSPMSSFIFFPAINALSTSLHISVEKINLTITSYMIVAGIAPAVIGDMADMTGRRTVYLLTMGIYCVANVGLAVQSSWTALFVLRMLQSAGGAGA